MRGTLIFWANGFWNDSPSKYQIFCFNVTDVRTLYARRESSVGNESPCVRHRLLQFRSTSQWVGGDLKWFGSRSQIIWREWENLSQLRMRGGLVWRKLHDSTANRCQLLLNISYQLVLNSHLHSNRWHYLSCHSLFWVWNFSHLSHFGLLERVSQLSGKWQLSSKLHLQYCTMYSVHRWHLFPVSFPFYFFSSFVFQLPLFLRLS